MDGTIRKERGQALVLIILAIVGMMGFAALAVDVGRVYAERRRAQNAADAAVMAWAFNSAWAQDPDPQHALNSLARNDFVTVPGRTRIMLNHPPANGPYAGDSEYFQVVLESTVDQIFGQFVSPGPYNLTVEAVGRAVPTQAVSPGQAMLAMGQNVCPGIVFNGGANTAVYGGNIYSNSNGNGPGSCYSGVTTGSSGSINVTGGDVLIAGGWNNTGGAYVNPPAQSGVGHLDIPSVPVPVCPSTTVRTPDTTNKRLYPGVYNSAVTINSGDWVMEPGMYCFHADVTINGNGSLTGRDVMIVMYDGSLDLGGGADVYLKRPNDIVDGASPAPNHFGGMLIYMPMDNDGGIDISGNNGSAYLGTIYAPGPRNPSSKEKCNIGGTGNSIGLSSNVMCHTIGIAGNSSVTINYREEENYRNPPTVELSQ